MRMFRDGEEVRTNIQDEIDRARRQVQEQERAPNVVDELDIGGGGFASAAERAERARAEAINITNEMARRNAEMQNIVNRMVVKQKAEAEAKAKAEAARRAAENRLANKVGVGYKIVKSGRQVGRGYGGSGYSMRRGGKGGATPP